MSKIDPPAGWPDVDGIDPFERLLGGPIPGSPINRSIGNLTSRTKFLRDNMLSAATLSAADGSSLVGFVQSGTGATPRTAQSKQREVVSVLDFGADPTGVADSSSAFSNAATRAGADGQVLVPAGTYLLTTPNIGSNSTSWVREGVVTLTGAGSLSWPWSRTPYKHRFGKPFGTEKLVDFNDPDDASVAQMLMIRSIAGGTDRSGNIYARVNNDSDTPNCSAMFDALHRGANSTGFPNAVTMYSTATKLNGAAVLSSYICVLSPATEVPGSEWNSGLTYAQEINYGNRWAEFGLQRDYTLNKWVGGTLYAPDVLQGADGGGITSEFNAQFGIIFAKATNGGKTRKTYIPILIAQDSIPDGGIGIHARGGTSPGRPLSIMEAALRWVNGIDLALGEFTGNAFRGKDMMFTLPATETKAARISTDAALPDELFVETNQNGAFGVTKPKFAFRGNGAFQIGFSNPPTAANSPGRAGDIQWDANYIYVCVAANTWKRTALSSW